MIFDNRLRSHHDSYKNVKNHFVEDVSKEEYLNKILNEDAKRNRVIYFHVPFCNKRCSFCPFYKPASTLRKNYDDYVINQIESIKHFKYMEKPFKAINFGGGTPTALKPNQMDKILSKTIESFNFTDDVEISIESSITELNDEMIDVLLKHNVNRLSIGVQSFNDNAREILNRRGLGKDVIKKLEHLKSKGFKNLNIDLIYNIPGETFADLENNLNHIIDLDLAGISFYSLILHEKTPIVKTISNKNLTDMKSIELEYEKYSLIIDKLKPYGYEMFELTKLIRNNLDRYEYIRTRHNYGDCVAIGNGAGGNIGNYSYRNAVDSLNVSDKLPISSSGKILNEKYYAIDKFIHDLQKGRVYLNEYNNILEVDLENKLKNKIEQFFDKNYLEYENGTITLTKKGAFWGNNIINEFCFEILKK